MAPTSARGEGMVIAERQPVGQRQPAAARSREERVRPGDAGDGDDGRSRGRRTAPPHGSTARGTAGRGTAVKACATPQRAASAAAAAGVSPVTIRASAWRTAPNASRRPPRGSGRSRSSAAETTARSTSRASAQVLEAVVEQVDGGAEAALGQGAGPEAIRTDEHAGAGHAARQHQRLVAGPRQIGQRPHAVADDGDAVGGIGPAVAAREDRRPLAGLDQQARQASHDRRLAAAAAGDVADRNHRPGQAVRPAGCA